MSDPPVAAQGIPYASPRGRWIQAVAIAGSGMAFFVATIVDVAPPDAG